MRAIKGCSWKEKKRERGKNTWTAYTKTESAPEARKHRPWGKSRVIFLSVSAKNAERGFNRTYRALTTCRFVKFLLKQPTISYPRESVSWAPPPPSSSLVRYVLLRIFRALRRERKPLSLPPSVPLEEKRKITWETDSCLDSPSRGNRVTSLRRVALRCPRRWLVVEKMKVIF